MNIEKGERKEDGISFAKQIGLGEFEVKLFNPSKEELGEFLGTEIEDDIEYVKENREGNTQVTLKFWLESGSLKLPVQFMLVDEVATNKEGTKAQYINQVGMSTWAEKEEDLPIWFTHFTDKDKNKIGDKKYRKAYKGEADFYNFLRNFLNNGSNFFAVNTDIFVEDMKKIFRGNFNEIWNTYMKSEFAGTVMAAAVVNSYEKDGETKYANRIYSKEFLPGYNYEIWKSRGKGANKNIQRFIDQMEYCKDVWIADELQDFHPEVVSKPSTSLNDSSY